MEKSSLFHRINEWIIKLFYIFPINKKCIVFRGDGGLGDNAKAFFDYLLTLGYNQTYKMVWLVDKPESYSSMNNVKFVRGRKGCLAALIRDYYIATARCIIYSHNGWLKKNRKGQVSIHTTHSAYQLKGDQGGKFEADYVLCCGKRAFEERLSGVNGDKSRLLVLGMPRLDLLYRHRNCVPTLYPDYNGEMLVLSMETFKQTYGWKDSSSTNDIFAINVVHTKDELVELDDFLNENKIIMVVKIHPLQDLSFLNLIPLKNIIYLTDDNLFNRGIDLYELIENANMLLTDYSSVFYDYLLLDRPIGFMLGDMQDYSRGFLSDNPLEEMTGEKIWTVSDLKDYLIYVKNGGDNYHEKRKALRDEVFSFQDGNNCKRLYDWMKNEQIIDC